MKTKESHVRDWFISFICAVFFIIILAFIYELFLRLITKTKAEAVVYSLIYNWNTAHWVFIGLFIIIIFLIKLWFLTFIKQWHFTDWVILFTSLILTGLVIVLLIIVKKDDKIPNMDCLPSILGNLGIVYDSTTNKTRCDIGVAIERVGFAIGGVIALLVALASLRRVKALDKTAEAEEQGNIEDRYKNATGQLGNDKSSVRLAGAYSLYHLAIDNKDRRKNICDVLCVYIRDITTSKDYIKTKTSNEVQIILNLLTK